MNSNPTRPRMLSLIMLTLMGTGCAAGSAAEPSQPFSGDVEDVLAITVRNQQLADARVHLLVDRQRVRLGTVRAGASEVFRYPMDQIRNVQIEFDVTLGPRCITQGMPLGPGDEAEATIPSQLVAFPGACRSIP